MKINKTKITITTLALAMGAALAGSISGSVAWYQYSTRASAQLAATSAGTSRDLQVAIKPTSGSASDSDYDQNLVLEAADAPKNLRPASYAAGAFYEQPVYKYAAQTAVGDDVQRTNADSVVTYAYLEYDLVFRCVDNNGTSEVQREKDVYLSGFELTPKSGDEDVTPAVRVRLDGTNDFILGIDSAAGSLDTHGNLDLNGNGTADTDGILTTDEAGNTITYYAGTASSSYTTQAKAAAIPTMTDAYAFTNTDNKALTTTAASGDSAVVKVQVWLEGWAQLGGSNIWSEDYIAQNFDLKLQFACEADYQ